LTVTLYPGNFPASPKQNELFALNVCYTDIPRFLSLQVQSFIEYFQDDCTDAIHWLSANNFFSGMTEGWATYVEGELLPQRTNLYTDTTNNEVLLQKYGMIYYQVLQHIHIKCADWMGSRIS